MRTAREVAEDIWVLPDDLDQWEKILRRDREELLEEAAKVAEKDATLTELRGAMAKGKRQRELSDWGIECAMGARESAARAIRELKTQIK